LDREIWECDDVASNRIGLAGRIFLDAMADAADKKDCERWAKVVNRGNIRADHNQELE
jgi:hypothetical protein